MSKRAKIIAAIVTVLFDELRVSEADGIAALEFMLRAARNYESNKQAEIAKLEKIARLN